MEENFDKDGVDGLLKKHPVAYNHPNKIKEGVIEKVLFFRKDYQLGYKKEVLANDKIAASNASYQTQNCAQSIAFCRSDVDIEKTLTPIAVVSAFNNSGLGYLKLNKPDSAIFFFSKAADFAKRKNWGIWEGIASGNLGDALHLQGRDQEAIPFRQKDYDSSAKYGEWGNAALTMAYISRSGFIKGGDPKALEILFWARAVNKKDPLALARLLAIQAEYYRKYRRHDSAEWCLHRHYEITDSVNRAAAQTNFSTVQLTLDFAANTYQ